ncbi:hypothetical protein BBFGKLBO_00715 [Synechococcus sp. CBW1107]|nr:hypothetical protein BBFGKLBO_00715 [Synechococcus sp. CBW1107]
MVFHARAVRADAELLDQLDAVPLPAIFHWKGTHWVALHRRQGQRFLIADPAVGLRWLPRADLLAGWSNGVMHLLEPDLHRLNAQEEAPRAPFLRFLQLALPYRGLLLQA